MEDLILVLILVCEEGPGICAHLLTIFSVLIIIVTLPFSLCLVVQVVQVSFDNITLLDL
jgi:hypothetical protein